jgi:hypothetical protein
MAVELIDLSIGANSQCILFYPFASNETRLAGVTCSGVDFVEGYHTNASVKLSID